MPRFGVRPRTAFFRGSVLTLGGAVALCFAMVAGCGDPGVTPPRVGGGNAKPADSEELLFENALDVLASQEDFDPDQSARQIVDRLDQWSREQKDWPEWKPEPLLATLPTHLREIPLLERLGERQFLPQYDGRFLQEVAMLRDIANTVSAGELDELQVADKLFDWTVRNIQLEPDKPTAAETPLTPAWRAGQHLPWEILLYGRGTAAERAWIFSLLARQRQLDVVLLSNRADTESGSGVWAAALAHNGKLFIYEPRLGLPLQDGSGKRATLAQLVADDSLLRALDAGPKMAYPTKAADLEKVAVLLEASPGYLSRRMKLVERQLAGERRMVLSTRPSELAASLAKLSHVETVKLWATPFSALTQRSSPEAQRRMMIENAPFRLKAQRPKQREQQGSDGEAAVSKARQEPLIMPLRAGRLLHFRGQLEGGEGAKSMLLLGRPGNDELRQMKAHPQLRELVPFVETMKQDATFWLGLATYQAGDYTVAIDYFRRTLRGWPAGNRVAAARYNLARSLEAKGELDEAIREYESDASPQRHGNLLRAAMLKESRSSATPEKPAPKVEDAAGERTPPESPKSAVDSTNTDKPAVTGSEPESVLPDKADQQQKPATEKSSSGGARDTKPASKRSAATSKKPRS